MAGGLVFSGLPGYKACTPVDKEMKHWDVVVVGGGPGGIPAAVAAARNGCRVLLIERYGFLGGMATTALVQPWPPIRIGRTEIIRGLFKEFSELLTEYGALQKDGLTFDAEMMKIALDRFVLDSGVDLLLHASVVGVYKKKGVIKGVKVYHKGGIEDISAEVFIDSSGDGDISSFSGCEIEIGRSQDQFCQPMTTIFQLSGVHEFRIPNQLELNRMYLEAKARGEISNPRDNVTAFRTTEPGNVLFNMTRIEDKSALNGWDLTDAEVIARKQIHEIVAFLQKHVPGYESAYLSKIAPQVGVRESRRVIGEYILTEEDVLSAKHFEDGIACGAYEIILHDQESSGTISKYVEEGQFYQIPYRCLVPKGINNLLVACRCISATHEAHASLRVQPIVWAIGQAGGTAASICIERGINASEVNITELKSKLISQQVFLE